MNKWFMVTLVGQDRAGIVAQVSSALYQGKCNLGEASMTRLGGNFSIMLMVQSDGDEAGIERLLAPVAKTLDLRVHVDTIEGELHHHVEPDVRITVYGADRAGIVADVTGALAEAGLNILNLESDVGGAEDSPIYVMEIEGVAANGIPALESVLREVSREKNVETRLTPIDTLLG